MRQCPGGLAGPAPGGLEWGERVCSSTCPQVVPTPRAQGPRLIAGTLKGYILVQEHAGESDGYSLKLPWKASWGPQCTDGPRLRRGHSAIKTACIWGRRRLRAAGIPQHSRPRASATWTTAAPVRLPSLVLNELLVPSRWCVILARGEPSPPSFFPLSSNGGRMKSLPYVNRFERLAVNFVQGRYTFLAMS